MCARVRACVCARACTFAPARVPVRGCVSGCALRARAWRLCVRACVCVGARVCARAALWQCLAEEVDGQRHMLGRYGTREAIER